MESDQSGEILEQPYSSEVWESLDEPESRNITNYDKIRKWQSRISVARKIRENKLEDLNTLIDYYEGIHWHLDEMPVMKDRTTVNLIFSNIKNELPSLYFQNPTPIVTAKKEQYEFNAFAMQELLKYYVKYNLGTNLKKHVRLCILDAKFIYGCLKTTYTPRFAPNPYAGHPVLEGFTEEGIPIFLLDESGNVVTQDGTIITSDLYYIERVSPREILIDPYARNFTKSWIGHEIVKPLKYLQDSSLYKNTDYLKKNIDVKDIFKSLNKDDEKAQELISDDDTQIVRFVEIYDLKNNELICLPDNCNHFIREENFYINPFTFLKFNEKPDDFFPVSDVAQEKPLQQEINIGRSMMITHARRSARKYGYDDDTFRGVDEREGIEAMKNPEDMTMVKLNDSEKPPVPIQMATQDPVIFQSLYQSRIDYNEVAGSTEAQRGVTDRRKTKGEAAFQEGHQQVRKGDKQSLVADFISETYEVLAKLMQSTMSIPQAVKIAGPSGIFWSQVTPEDIKGEMFFEIEVSDLRPQIPELDRQELSEFIFALSQFLNSILSNPVGQIVFDIKGTIKEFAKSYPSINVENILNLDVTPADIAKLVLAQLNSGQNNANI